VVPEHGEQRAVSEATSPTISSADVVEEVGRGDGVSLLEFGIEGNEVSIVSLRTRENQTIERIQ
jgi:hypothetical protein